MCLIQLSDWAKVIGSCEVINGIVDASELGSCILASDI